MNIPEFFMCGINGIVSTDTQTFQVPENCLKPMFSPDGSKAVLLDGRIYGFQEICRNLDYPFRTQSEVEVILALYVKYNKDMLKHLPGMFAFALWDDRNKTLFCARDRFGEKPFFYAKLNDGSFIFSSEIKTILASGKITPKLNKTSLSHYLQHLYVPPNQTIYENIHCLPPAHAITFINGKPFVWRYWDLPEPVETWTLSNAVERFRELLANAVQNQLTADVEVGAFLSGGLDSSTIVYEAAKQKSNLKTVAFGFSCGLDERSYARSVATLYSTNHMEFNETELDIPALLKQMVTVYDEPFADSSNIPTYLLAQKAAEYVKVILTGDGGDELLAGYEGWYQPLLRRQREHSKKRRNRFIYAALCACSRVNPVASARLNTAIAHYRDNLYFPGVAGAHHSNGFFPSEELTACDLPVVSQLLPLNLSNTVDDALRMDILTYMPGDILVKTDRAARANGLELRAPFLDVNLASFLISLPLSLKMSETESKILLRAAYADKWPVEIRRRSKQGFGAPVAAWLQQSVMRELCNDAFCTKRRIHNFFPRDFINKYACSGNYQTWILLVLSLWLEEYGGSI